MSEEDIAIPQAVFTRRTTEDVVNISLLFKDLSSANSFREWGLEQRLDTLVSSGVEVKSPNMYRVAITYNLDKAELIRQWCVRNDVPVTRLCEITISEHDRPFV
jgi:hypothetical protein